MKPRCARGSRWTPPLPAEYKQDSYKAYLMCFGSTGMFEQDDVENWVSLTTTAGGSMARRLLLNSRMGLLVRRPPGRRGADCRVFPRSRDALRSATTSTTSASCSTCGPTIFSAPAA